MLTNISIETWTRKQCEEYLKQYPSSLKSDAVRKRLRALTPPQPPKPQPSQPPKSQKAGNNSNVADVVGAVKQTKEGAFYPQKNQTTKLGAKPQSTSNSQQNQTGGSSSVDEHDRLMAVVGKVFLSILALALCIGLGWGMTELFGVSYGLAGRVVSGAVAVPLEALIWKK